MIGVLLPEVADRLDGDAVAARRWIAGARVIHLASKWEGRAAFVLFSASDPVPRLVVKVDRTRRGRRRLRREHDALQSVAGVPELAGTVPRSVVLFEHADALVLVQTALDGRTLAVDLRRRLRPTVRRIRVDHDLVLTWLDDLQRARTRDGSTPRRPVDVDQTVALATQVLPGDEAWAKGTVGRMARFGADVGTIHVALAHGHGDLGPSNVIVAPGGRRRPRSAGWVGVIDWEGASTQMPVLNDVLMFLHHYARAMPTPRHGLMDRHDVAAAAFLGTGMLASETWRRWCSALERAGLPVGAARYVLLALLLQFATNATEYAHSDRVSPMWTEITRRYAREWARQGFPEGPAIREAAARSPVRR